MTCWSSVTSRPPYSRGHDRQVQPAAPSARSQARRSSKSACSSPGPPRPRTTANSPSSCPVSHSRASRRKRSSSSEKCRSTSGSLADHGRSLPNRLGAPGVAEGDVLQVCIGYADPSRISCSLWSRASLGVAPRSTMLILVRRTAIVAIALATVVGFGAAAYLFVPWHDDTADAAPSAPKVRPTGTGRFELVAWPPPNSTGIPPETTIKVDAQNGRIRELVVKAPDGTTIPG